jgi:phage tail sheath protein FI
MPVTPKFTYPGVYVQEVPTGVLPIVGVPTSVTAFIGRTLRGKVNDPKRIQSIAQFDRDFGGLWMKSPMTYAVQQYFVNGGSEAEIVRVIHSGDLDPSKNAVCSTASLNGLQLEAASEGSWGDRVRVAIDYKTGETTDPDPFNMMVYEHEKADAASKILKEEKILNVSVAPEARRNVKKVLEQKSELIRLINDPAIRPAAGETMLVGGNDGDLATLTEYLGNQNDKTGLYALENSDIFNLLCIPPRDRLTYSVVEETGADNLLGPALAYCKARRAMLVLDPPGDWDGPSDVTGELEGSGSRFGSLMDPNAALYYPRLKASDSLQDNAVQEFAPCGAVAGICARTDNARGVWKAPAGTEATITGISGLSYALTDGENGQLNPWGVNCLRVTPEGRIVWGARTLRGADRFASEWKYLPVRRTALFIEESLYRGLKWVVFEPNDEPLWAQVRLNVGAFMNNLFRQGAFQGATPKEAYFVKCDKETTTQNDINLGLVNIWVGFAPLKPAEFVIIYLQQMAGQIQT